MKLYNIRLLVSEFKKTFIFYRDILGLQLEYGEEEGVYASFVTPQGIGIALFKRDLMSQVLGTEGLPSKVAAQDQHALIFVVEDVDKQYHALKDKGCTFLNPPCDMEEWGVRVVHMRDPDGHLIEFCAKLA